MNNRNLEILSSNNFILNEMPGMVWVMNEEGKFIFYNKEWIQFKGKNIENDLLGNWIEDIHIEERIQFKKSFEEKLARRESFEITYRLLNIKNKYRWIRSKIKPIIDNEGIFTGFIGWSCDISDIVEHEDKLNSDIENAKKASYYKTLFLSNMAHEIKTPLNGIIGITQLLCETKMDNEQLEYIELLRYSSSNLLDVTEQILDISKIESGKFEIANSEFDMNTVIKESIKMMEFKAKAKGIRFSYNYLTDYNKILIGDPVRLKQIIVNLVNNAIKFTDNGSVVFSINAKKIDEKFDRLEISVLDSGIGIEKENIEKIFEEYEQLNTDITKNYGGTGLGLSIVKKIVDLLGGKISVESEIGKGSVFSVVLDIEKKMCEQVKKEKGQFLAENYKILVVDDNTINRKIMRKFLEKLGGNVDEADSGIAAIEMNNNKHYDIIFMDIQMPKMDGIETSRIIREKEASGDNKAVIIAVTAFDSEDSRNRSKKVGINYYYVKPLNLSVVNNIFEIIKKRGNDYGY